MAGIHGPASTHHMQLILATDLEKAVCECVWVCVCVCGRGGGGLTEKLVTFVAESIKKKSTIQLMALQLISLILKSEFLLTACFLSPSLLLSLLRPVVFVTEGGYYYYYCKQGAAEKWSESRK